MLRTPKIAGLGRAGHRLTRPAARNRVRLCTGHNGTSKPRMNSRLSRRPTASVETARREALRAPESKDVSLMARDQKPAVRRPGHSPRVGLLEIETRYFPAGLRLKDPNRAVVRRRRQP